MNKLDPHFGGYTGSATADTDNSISKIRAEVSALFWSAKILEQLRDPSASMQRTLDRVVDRVEQRVNLSDFWTAAAE
jgi:hypothetical protein